MRRITSMIIGLIGVIMCFVAGISFGINLEDGKTLTKLPATKFTRPLETYSVESLRNYVPKNEPLVLNPSEENSQKEFDSYIFELSFNPNPLNSDKKKTTGLLNIPVEEGEYPLVIMIRGYVDQSIYKTGIGTKRAGEVFAKNSFITIAPDFLGYAGSSQESGNVFETRFQTYTTMLSLLSSLEEVPKWNKKDVFIWAHSNGGQVALTTLSITKKQYPTTLWAPVTKPFPYSVLYYTDESQDKGKFIRKELAKFENLYDVDKFSFDNYLTDIEAKIQLHQGTADDAVPEVWSADFVKKAKQKEVSIEYFKYPGSDHNLQPAWNEVVEKDIAFFQKNMVP